MTKYCPACGEEAIAASGSKDSEILIIGEFPGEEEMEIGRPFVGPTGKVLRRELAKVGLDMVQCRVTNLWIHPQTDDENCLRAGMSLALDEAKGKKAVLLLGSECAYKFLNMRVMDVCGLQVESPLLSAPLVMAVVNPAYVFQKEKGVGELRLGIQKFAKKCVEMGLIREVKEYDDEEE